MRIFVTGGTGFTGAALVKRLLRDGHSVVSLDKQPGLIDDELKSLGAEIVYGSVADRAAVAQCSKGAEVVLASRRGLPRDRRVGRSLSFGQCRRDAHRRRRGAEGGRAQARLLQHARRAWTYRGASRRRDLADCAGRLLPADQVRRRAGAEAAGWHSGRIHHSQADCDLRTRRSRPIPDDLPSCHRGHFSDVRRRPDVLPPGIRGQSRRRVRARDEARAQAPAGHTSSAMRSTFRSKSSCRGSARHSVSR